jgi:hypothetical protein
MKSKTFIFLFFSIFIFYLPAQSAKRNNDESVAAIGKDSFGRTIKVRMKTMAFPKNYGVLSDRTNIGFRGAGYFPPKYLISSFKVWADSKEIFVPLTSYMDLTNVSEILIRAKEKGNFELLIKGGDAASSYVAVILVENDEVSQRKLYDGEMGAEGEGDEGPFEQTVYGQNWKCKE